MSATSNNAAETNPQTLASRVSNAHAVIERKYDASSAELYDSSVSRTIDPLLNPKILARQDPAFPLTQKLHYIDVLTAYKGVDLCGSAHGKLQVRMIRAQSATEGPQTSLMPNSATRSNNDQSKIDQELATQTNIFRSAIRSTLANGFLDSPPSFILDSAPAELIPSIELLKSMARFAEIVKFMAVGENVDTPYPTQGGAINLRELVKSIRSGVVESPDPIAHELKTMKTDFVEALDSLLQRQDSSELTDAINIAKTRSAACKLIACYGAIAPSLSSFL